LIAYDYPLLGMFWTMLWFFLWVAWLMLLFRVFGDIFRSDDMGGFAKTIWCVVVLLLPFLGVFIYVIARGDNMREHDLAAAQAQDAAFRTYVQSTVTSGGSADELAKLAELKDRGVLTEAEFAQQKSKLLA
jgi:hypothetical protein